MKIFHFLTLTLIIFSISCQNSTEKSGQSFEKIANNRGNSPRNNLTDEKAFDESFVAKNYEKREYFIPMRDGVKLYTSVYLPKDTSQTYPILMKRTPYGCKPYGIDKFPTANLLAPSVFLAKDLYIFVHQDVRGRYMSEGVYDNMRPQLTDVLKAQGLKIDESTDTYDTIEFLIKELSKKHNGKVGQWGISYPGFYAAVGALSRHPALVASSPQAPIADFFFDDFHHHGAYMLSYWQATSIFGYQKKTATTSPWYEIVDMQTPDAYEFFLKMGALSNASKYYKQDNFFWQQLVEHPNYDSFWQERNLLPHLKNINHAVLTVGGWFDAEDLYGPLNIYQTIEKENPSIFNALVMGPWSHGDWARIEKKQQVIGDIYFGDSIQYFYQKEIELRFFQKYLKGKDEGELSEAYLFDTGKKEWKIFSKWTPDNLQKKKLYLHEKEKLVFDKAPTKISTKASFSEFISDPFNPVPDMDWLQTRITPKEYMTADQRFASKRPDVLVFESEPLEKDITLAGKIIANLQVSTNQTDADWIVKLIDVLPHDEPDHEFNMEHVKMGGYQMLVRSEMIRGRFRESYELPKPFVPHQITKIQFPLQDILHTFKKGHKIMVQIQSTCFPLIDRNPQKYVENIFKAKDEDFTKAFHRVYHSVEHPTFLEVGVLE
ncbi:MAG: CocE/NonD family hydrolase [Flammeovirgaceae bacterium]